MCEIRPDNLPSRRVVERCGFVRDAEQKHWRLNYYDKPLEEYYLYRESFLQNTYKGGLVHLDKCN